MGTIRQQGQREDRGLAWPPRPGGHPALVAKPAVSRAAWPRWQGLCHAVGSLLQPFLPFVVIPPRLVPSREGAVGSYSVTLKWGSGQRLQIVTEPPGGAGQGEAVRARQQELGGRGLEKGMLAEYDDDVACIWQNLPGKR